MNTVYTYVVYHGEILYPPDFPFAPERRNGRAVVRFELPPKVESHSGVFDITFADEYTMPSIRRRFTSRTVRYLGFAGEYVSRPDAECIIDKRENVTLRKDLHGAERCVKECKEKLRNAVVERRKFERQRDRGDYDGGSAACDLKHRRDAETSSRLSRAQHDLFIATRRLLDILLSLGTIDADELERRMLNCDEYLRRFC